MEEGMGMDKNNIKKSDDLIIVRKERTNVTSHATVCFIPFSLRIIYHVQLFIYVNAFNAFE